MRSILRVIGVLLVLAGPVWAAQAPSPHDAAAIQAVISAQMQAFQRNDAVAAWSFASPGIQSQTGNPAKFMAMVRNDYQPVYRPRSTQFTRLGALDGAVVQEVELTGPDGQAYTARYTMELEPDGSWRIAACTLEKSHRVGV